MRRIQAIGGSRLFNYLDEDGKAHPITPRDVNTYIKAVCGPEFSAKDFRTWGGTLLAALTLADMGKPENEKQARRNSVQAAKRVAERLGNTPTVCRDCYIHPIVFERYLEGITLEDFRPRAERTIRLHHPEYHPEELALMKLFQTAPNDSASRNGHRSAAQNGNGREHVSRTAERPEDYSPGRSGVCPVETISASASA